MRKIHKKYTLMPLEPFLHSGAWLNSRPIVRGAIITTLINWQLAQCPPIDFEGDIMHLTGLDLLSSKRYGNLLKEALKQIMPVITDYLKVTKKPVSAKELERRRNLSIASKKRMEDIRLWLKDKATDNLKPSMRDESEVLNILPILAPRPSSSPLIKSSPKPTGSLKES